MSVQPRVFRTAILPLTVRRAIAAACLVCLSSCAWWQDVYIFSSEPTHKPAQNDRRAWPCQCRSLQCSSPVMHQEITDVGGPLHSAIRGGRPS